MDSFLFDMWLLFLYTVAAYVLLLSMQTTMPVMVTRLWMGAEQEVMLCMFRKSGTAIT